MYKSEFDCLFIGEFNCNKTEIKDMEKNTKIEIIVPFNKFNFIKSLIFNLNYFRLNKIALNVRGLPSVAAASTNQNKTTKFLWKTEL